MSSTVACLLSVGNHKTQHLYYDILTHFLSFVPTPNLLTVKICVTDSVVTLTNVLTEVSHNNKIVRSNLKANDQIESLRKIQLFQSRL